MTRRERRHSQMMSRGTGRAVTLTASEKQTAGEVRVQEWTRGERLRRGGKLWAALWALAVVSVLIPGAHFVLVPGFLLAGPIAGYLRTRQTRGILGGEGVCPACGARIYIGAHPDSWPLSDHCDACRRPVLIEAVGGPGTVGGPVYSEGHASE
jgi:hypothetical protein